MYIPTISNIKQLFRKRICISYLFQNYKDLLKTKEYVCGWFKHTLWIKRSLHWTQWWLFTWKLADFSRQGSLKIRWSQKIDCRILFRTMRRNYTKPGQKAFEIQIRKEKGHYIKIFGDCPGATYSLAKKELTYEYLREIAHLIPRTTFMEDVLRVRNSLIYTSHNFFQSKWFIYLHYPLILASDCKERYKCSRSLQCLLKPIKTPPSFPLKKIQKWLITGITPSQSQHS